MNGSWMVARVELSECEQCGEIHIRYISVYSNSRCRECLFVGVMNWGNI